MSNKREIQHESALLNEIKSLLDGGKTTFHSVARYETPPGVYDNNDLVTYGFVVNLLGIANVPLIVTVPAGTVLEDDNGAKYYPILVDAGTYGVDPTVIIKQTSVNGGVTNISPRTYGAIDYSTPTGLVFVYLPNNGTGVTEENYRIIIKA